MQIHYVFIQMIVLRRKYADHQYAAFLKQD